MEENKELEAVETTEEKVEEAVEAVETTEEKVEEAVETVETTEEKVEEAVETVETTEEKVEEAVEATETTEEAPTEETTEPTQTPETTDEVETEGELSEEEEEPKKKVKKKLDKTNIIVIIICAIVVLACFGFLGYKLGWFDFLKTGEIKLPDYKNIEVANQAVETSDELVDSYIDELLQTLSTAQPVYEGVVEEGDTVNIDYAGKIAATGEAFEGGTSQGYDLVIGSGSFIEGFEDQLIGMKVGDSKTINVTFPENYQNTELAGVPATFDVKVNYKSVQVKPELTDEWVKKNGSNFIEGKFSNVKEFKEGMKEYIYKMQLHAAMFEDIQSKQEIKSYNEKQKKEIEEYLMQKLEEQAAYYQYDADSLAQMFGAESAQAYVTSQAEQYLSVMMPIDEIFKKEHLKVTDKQVDEYLQRYLYQQGVGDTFTVEQIKEEQGEVWVKLYKELEVKYDIAMTALEKYVKFIDAADTETQPASN